MFKTRYRVCAETDFRGETKYFPQFKVWWFFWWINFSGEYDDYSFDTMLQAEDFIHSQRKEKNVVREYFYVN